MFYLDFRKYMKNLLIRSITGITLVVLIISGILYSKYSFALLFFIIMIGCLIEFFYFFRTSGIHPLTIYSVFIGGLFFLFTFLITSEILSPPYYLLFPVAFLFLPVYELFRKKGNNISNIATGILGLSYIATPFCLSNYVVFINGTYNSFPLILLFILIWTNDTGAYLVGMSMGKHKLFPRISPKKSWEGLIGGIILTILVSLIFVFIKQNISVFNGVLLGILVSVSSVFGDFTESMFKRSFNIKDSGKLIPGHGGFLDRFDSMLFAVPIYLCYIKLFGIGI